MHVTTSRYWEGLVNPEVMCARSRSQRQVGDSFESLDEPKLDEEIILRRLSVLRRALAHVLLLLAVTRQAQRLRATLERNLWPCAGLVERPEERRPVAPVTGGELGDDVDGLVSLRRGCGGILVTGAVPGGPARGRPVENGLCQPGTLILRLFVGDSTRERCSTHPRA